MTITAKKLKEILADVSDDALVVVCNPNWTIMDIINHQLVENACLYENKDILYLDVEKHK